jgi:imidazolonepropionase-like amidohydrolase
LRAQVLPPQQVIASATHIAARLLRMEGQVGTLAPGAFADVVLARKNPLEDISILSGQGEGLSVILKGGVVVKDDL